MNKVAPTLRKAIRGPADLAVNGAPPLFAEPVHVGRPNMADEAQFLARATAILRSGRVTNDGPTVRDLEARLADLLDVRHVVATCNGTLALQIAMRALDVTAGEVITPAFTFIATPGAVRWIGLEPVFADIDPLTHALDPASARAAVGPRTRAILATHLWGWAAPVEALQAVADEAGVPLVFDAAQAFLCSHGGRLIGGFGAAEVFSFHATKFFNTFEGGAVATNDDAVAKKLRRIRNFGFADYDCVLEEGVNAKMSEIAAAHGLASLDALDAVLDANAAAHAAWAAALGDVRGVTVTPPPAGERVNHQYVIAQIGPDAGFTRDGLVEALHAEKILARRYFWPGCHRMAPYGLDRPAVDLPMTDRVSARILVLPTGPALPPETPAAVAAICRALAAR